jgi:dihydrofolate reductase
MRKLIAGFKISLDGKIESSAGFADWVEAWSEDYNLGEQIDTCLLGGAMYPGYEAYWSALAAAPNEAHPMTGTLPTIGEKAWSERAANTPHVVLSTKLSQANWPQTTFIRAISDIQRLKAQEGKTIYLMGGANITAQCITAGLLDEIRLIVYPILIGAGKQLFGELGAPKNLALLESTQRADGRLFLRYGLSTQNAGH